MYFNADLGRCATRLGEDCTKYAQCEPNALCSVMVEWIRLDYEYFIQRKKVMNEIALLKDKDGTCVCVPGTTENERGKCVGSLHAPCSAESPCNTGRGLTCIDGLC
jgi:hypothetical protein